MIAIARTIRALLPVAVALGLLVGGPATAAEPSAAPAAAEPAAAEPAAAQPAAAKPARLADTVDRAVRPLLKQYDVPGIAVGVTVGGEQHFFAYGVASRAGKEPVTKDTLFEIGSVSKTFAATLAGYAVADGAMSLEDHPGKFMPALSGTAIDNATVLNLGTYTAGGLPLQFPGSIGTDAEMTEYFRSFKPRAAPGRERRYSNPSIGLFGHVTALALKGDYTGLVETKILPGLGLSNTYIRVPADQMARYAWGTSKSGKPIRVGDGVLGAPAYGIKTSAADLIRYVELNMQPETLAPQIRSAIEATHIGYFKVGEMVQGLGWEQYPYPVTLKTLLAGNARTMAYDPHPATPLANPAVPSQPTLYNKTGSTNGFGTYVAFVPSRRIGVVFVANRALPTPARITAVHAVLEQLSMQVP